MTKGGVHPMFGTPLYEGEFEYTDSDRDFVESVQFTLNKDQSKEHMPTLKDAKGSLRYEGSYKEAGADTIKGVVNPATDEQSYSDFVMTHKLMNILANNPQLSHLKKIALEHARSFILNHIEYDMPDHTDLVISDSWAGMSLNNAPQAIMQHDHQYCMLSGIFYFSDGNPLRLSAKEAWDSRTPFIWPHSRPNMYNQSDFIIFPKKGMILLWPAHVTHEVIESDDKFEDEFRTTLVFNVMPSGLMTRKTGSYGKWDVKEGEENELDYVLASHEFGKWDVEEDVSKEDYEKTDGGHISADGTEGKGAYLKINVQEKD